MTTNNENATNATNDNLNIVPEDDNMQGDTGTDTGAGASTPEDTSKADNPYQSTIDQQNSTIQALMEQNERLTTQINKLIRNGAAIIDDSSTGNASIPDNPDITENDDYVPLKDLGSEFGKR